MITMMKIIVGIDEVGRGSWAGPVVAGAAILLPRRKIDGLRDSKKLTLLRRELLVPQICRNALAVGLGWVSNKEVDENGLTWAVQESGLRALRKLQSEFDHVILDGKHNYLKDELFSTEVIIGADDKIPSVSAASILAKVARDRYMRLLHRAHPNYGFDRHVGYGTEVHRLALQEFGPSPLHRLSYQPVKLVIPHVYN
jgi:ribonuclease HII